MRFLMNKIRNWLCCFGSS